jgi:hypothetical protein
MVDLEFESLKVRVNGLHQLLATVDQSGEDTGRWHPITTADVNYQR